MDAVGNLLPYYQLKDVHDIVGFNKRKMDFLGEVNVYNSDFHDISSEWVEDTISETFHKKATDNEADREYIFLFRLLAIKYRIHYPIRGGNGLRIDENLMLFLERWIVQAFCDYYSKTHPDFRYSAVKGS